MFADSIPNNTEFVENTKEIFINITKFCLVTYSVCWLITTIYCGSKDSKLIHIEFRASRSFIPAARTSESPAQQRNVGVAAVVFHAVAYQNAVKIMPPYIAGQAGAVIAEVKDVNLREIFQ
jgi:hypothetical protein